MLSARHITPTAFARKIGVSHVTIFKLLGRKNPDLQWVRKVGVALNYNFFTEIAATGNDFKSNEVMETEFAARQEGLMNETARLRNELERLIKEMAAKEVLIEKKDIEIRYLKEVVEAYKGVRK